MKMTEYLKLHPENLPELATGTFQDGVKAKLRRTPEGWACGLYRKKKPIALPQVKEDPYGKWDFECKKDTYSLEVAKA